LRKVSFNWASFGSFATRFSISAQPFLVPLLLQSVYGLEAVQAGLFMLPAGVGAYIARQKVGALLNRTGYKVLLVWNTLIITFIFMTYVIQAYVYLPYLLVAQQFFFGAAFAVQAASMNSCAYQFTHEPHVSKAISFYSAVIQLSASFGVAIAAFTMVSVIGRADLTHHVPVIAFKVVFLAQAIYGFIGAYAFSRIKPVPDSHTDR
jgi:predicted MFS family arabinose efflux permease